MRESGYYWVATPGDAERLEVAHWDGSEWNFCGAEACDYAEPDDPTGHRVRVVSPRLSPPENL